jgi:hypothetical protein
VTDTCNPSTGEAEAGGSQIQIQPELHSEFLASLEPRLPRPCQKKKKKVNNGPKTLTKEDKQMEGKHMKMWST